MIRTHGSVRSPSHSDSPGTAATSPPPQGGVLLVCVRYVTVTLVYWGSVLSVGCFFLSPCLCVCTLLSSCGLRKRAFFFCVFSCRPLDHDTRDKSIKLHGARVSLSCQTQCLFIQKLLPITHVKSDSLQPTDQVQDAFSNVRPTVCSHCRPYTPPHPCTEKMPAQTPQSPQRDDPRPGSASHAINYRPTGRSRSM